MKGRSSAAPVQNLPKRLTGRPKREMSTFGSGLSATRVSTRYEGHGVEYHPKVTENGHTEQGNPSGALSARQGMEQATRPQALTE